MAAGDKASFSQLPVELVEQIVSYLIQPDIYAVSQLNSSLYKLARPFLYSHVDLNIPLGNHVPRVDIFCLNVINDSQLAARVDSLHVGLRPEKGVRGGQHLIPRDKNFDDGLMITKALDTMSSDSQLIAMDHLCDAIGRRDYSAYAVLILLVLPALRHLAISNLQSGTLLYLQRFLQGLGETYMPDDQRESLALIRRLSCIQTLSICVDSRDGVAYSYGNHHEVKLDFLSNLPSITKLELSIPGPHERYSALPHRPDTIIDTINTSNITTLALRHSVPQLTVLRSLLRFIPRLKSLTYELLFSNDRRQLRQQQIIDLHAMGDVLWLVKDTLETLVLSVEYCDARALAFSKQPRIGDKLFGFLDFTSFPKLHSLQVPFPVLTGDADFSIISEVCPLLPPNLRHISLRPDLSHAQFPFPFDTSILANVITFHDSKDEARYLMSARMDVSYMFQATLSILEQASSLETISVWQPADPSLGWFEGQVADFATACSNKQVTGKLVYPMLLRWKKAQDWDLVKESTVFNRLHPDQHQENKFFRSEWEGMDLGLGIQYHLHALRSHKVRLHR